METNKQSEKTMKRDAATNSTHQANPFTLFLILILLINSFGLTSLIFKKNKKQDDKGEG